MSEPKRCDMTGCWLPVCCEVCGTCAMHCGGSMHMWAALKYWLGVWWSLRSWKPRQGGWYVRF